MSTIWVRACRDNGVRGLEPASLLTFQSDCSGVVPFLAPRYTTKFGSTPKFPSSIDVSICLRVGLANISRIDCFRSDLFRLELFRLFARLASLFGLVRFGAIRSVTAISHSITYPARTPARTGGQGTSLADAEADGAQMIFGKDSCVLAATQSPQDSEIFLPRRLKLSEGTGK